MWQRVATMKKSSYVPLKRVIMRFACYYGLHDWTYFRMANSFITAFPNDLGINRRCDWCNYMQYTDDGKTWKLRL
jgi:hypothetical protein